MRTCVRCVMNDEADDQIAFDENGCCNYCAEAIANRDKLYFPNEEGASKLKLMLNRLKAEGSDKEYDCVMGLSGGLDSSYLAYLGVAKWGLRIAAIHIDDGYDTDISKKNIEKLIKATGIDLVTVQPDADEFNDLTLAYMKAGVPNLAIPQDNVLFAFLYDFAKSKGIRHFLSGSNFALEGILQRGNTWNPYDVVNIMDIHERFGTKGVDKLKFLSSSERRQTARKLHVETHTPLDYIEYNRDAAFAELAEYCGFEYYGRKHLENHLTAFVQLCWLPAKFGVDKRTSHLSSMIVSNQMTREEAQKELKEPLCTEEYMDYTKEIICSSIGITRDYLEELIDAPFHQHDEYKTDASLGFRRKLKKLLRR